MRNPDAFQNGKKLPSFQRLRLEAQFAVDHVERCVFQRLTTGVGSADEPVERFGKSAVQLRGNHARCLVHAVAEVAAVARVASHSEMFFAEPAAS